MKEADVDDDDVVAGPIILPPAVTAIFEFVILWFLSLCSFSSFFESKNKPQTVHLEILLVILVCCLLIRDGLLIQ